MREKRVLRYYCDFCKKSGCAKGHMKNHEIHCTNNPNRICGMCKYAKHPSASLPNLISILPNPKTFWTPKPEFSGGGYYKGLNKAVGEVMPTLRKLAGNCPVCILAALRQANIPVYMAEDFDYKKEIETMWNQLVGEA